MAAILRIRVVARRDGESLFVVGSDKELIAACGEEAVAVLDPEQEETLGFLRELA